MWSFFCFFIITTGIFSTSFAKVNFTLSKKINKAPKYRTLLPNQSEPQNFALLVAGGVRAGLSLHYAIEAGVLGASDLLIRNNIPAKNMVLMSYDDAAEYDGNPCKGKVFNSPEWRNVYDPSTVDYTDLSVTPENVLNVLRGDSAAVIGGNGRVIESTSSDRIFVFISGASQVRPPGIAFQNFTRLWASDFVKTLRWMKENGKYAEMVVYLDIDVGGQFLEEIPKDINVYGIAATGIHFYSRGILFCKLWHCDGEMPCLTTEFAYDWQEDVKNSDLTTKTFHEHVESMKNLTVDYEEGMGEYGDLSIGRKPMGCFFGNQGKSASLLKC